jgi:hypothetical protein
MAGKNLSDQIVMVGESEFRGLSRRAEVRIDVEKSATRTSAPHLDITVEMIWLGNIERSGAHHHNTKVAGTVETNRPRAHRQALEV